MISHSHSLEVSELTLYSKLGQPLSAEIRVKHNPPLSGDELIIELASEKIYKTMGVKTAPAFIRLKFDHGKNGIVKVSTREPIKEPFLNFVLLFRWAEGDIYREFNVLLDPS
ncbi:MAG: pilus assembly protein FimV [Oceanicoccus sp.]|jgi:pilus assembly protein FimV